MAPSGERSQGDEKGLVSHEEMEQTPLATGSAGVPPKHAGRRERGSFFFGLKMISSTFRALKLP